MNVNIQNIKSCKLCFTSSMLHCKGKTVPSIVLTSSNHSNTALTRGPAVAGIPICNYKTIIILPVKPNTSL